MGIITGAGIQGIFILVAGFFKLPNNIPKPFWRYPLHYVAFHTYAFQGLFKNEYEGLKFHGGLTQKKYITGGEILRDTWQTDMSYSKWVDLAILLGMIVIYRVMFLVIIKTTER
ncbi:ATP-binding cassette sub- G member 1, partial [Stylosanthes scabra]|nr:ATP-binding cassette sub- G member 1 [Stylosanthes scabra]